MDVDEHLFFSADVILIDLVKQSILPLAYLFFLWILDGPYLLLVFPGLCSHLLFLNVWIYAKTCYDPSTWGYLIYIL